MIIIIIIIKNNFMIMIVIIINTKNYDKNDQHWLLNWRTCFTANPFKSTDALAREIINSIRADTTVNTRGAPTLVHVQLAISTLVPRQTSAAVGVEKIGARPSIHTGSTCALIRVCGKKCRCYWFNVFFPCFIILQKNVFDV